MASFCCLLNGTASHKKKKLFVPSYFGFISKLEMLFSSLVLSFYYENNVTLTTFYVHMETTCTDIGMRMCMRVHMGTADCVYIATRPKSLGVRMYESEQIKNPLS